MIAAQYITLSELQRRVRQVLEERFALPLWVSAEIAEVKVNYSGHCYLELVEKGEGDGVHPVPEIMPDIAKAAGARVVGTGRSDFPNQVNNVIAFPGIFKGALEGRATQITEEMKLAAALAIANLIPESQLSDTNILPEAFDPQVTDVVAKAVMDHIR